MSCRSNPLSLGEEIRAACFRLLTVPSLLSQNSNPHDMWRLLFFRMNWLILEVILLNTAAAFFPATPELSPSSHVPAAFARSSPDSNDRLFMGTSSVSHGLSLQCERQGRQVLALVHSFSLFPQLQERNDHFRSPLLPVFYPAFFFSPRKLSPPLPQTNRS